MIQEALPTKNLELNRKIELRRHIDKKKKILEIGPAYDPIAAKCDGYNTIIVDNLSKENLQKKYSSHGVNVDIIEDVDYIWKSGKLSDLIQFENYGTFDTVLASNVLEHIPDPVAFIQSLVKLLNPDGIITLALPDKRYCFDLFRPLTTAGNWLDARDRNSSVHSPLTRFEYEAYVVRANGATSWGHQPIRDLAFAFAAPALTGAYVAYQQASMPAQGEYVDSHAWVFTPSSFTLLIFELQALGVLPVRPVQVVSGPGFEFFVHLVSCDDGKIISDDDRLLLLKNMAREEIEGLSQLLD